MEMHMDFIDGHLSCHDPGAFEIEWKLDPDRSEVAKKSESTKVAKKTVTTTRQQANVNAFDVNSKQRQN